MEKLHFDIEIKAPASKVHRAVTDKQSYGEWTAEFNPGSTFEGGWNKGDKIYFVGVGKDGKREGMVAQIEENIPGKQISIRHKGMLDGENEIMEGPAVEKWANALEEYLMEENNGVTHFKVSVDTMAEYKDYFEKTWPKALNKLKEIAER